MEREKLGSRLGFILLSAGCAIGIGNVWKFPYMVGQYGGAVFILIYLVFLVILGIPAMTMEFAMGRAAQKSIAGIYQKLEPAGSKWHVHRWFAIAGNYLLMMFYTTVAGWMLRYFFHFILGRFENLDAAGITQEFSSMLSQPVSSVVYTLVVVVIGFLVCMGGVQKGLEKVTKSMMVLLLGVMIVLAVNSLFLSGAEEGLAYYLLPNWQLVQEIGLGTVIVAAMNQAFFTLSLGIGAMAIFGSYIEKDHTLLKESVNVAFLDTFVAITAGFIIIPACFAYNVEVTSGPSLIFLALPNIFNAMPLGRLWGALFFLFLSFAAFSTVFTVFENILSSTMDLFGWDRKKACLINMLVMAIASLPCALGFNVLSGFAPLGAGTTIMDLEDFVVSNWLLPLGALVFVLFCTWDFGWGWKNFTHEANTGKGISIPDWIHPYCKYILPAAIVFVFVMGLI